MKKETKKITNFPEPKTKRPGFSKVEEDLGNDIIEKCFQEFKQSTDGKLMHACFKNDDEVLKNFFNKALLPFINIALEERNKQVEKALDSTETFFIADWGAPDWGRKFPQFFTIHFDICRVKMKLEPKHHPKIMKNLEKEMEKVFQKAEEHSK